MSTEKKVRVENLQSIIEKVGFNKERFVLLVPGRPDVAIVPVEDLKILERIEDEIFINEAERALDEVETISWDKFKKELGL